MELDSYEINGDTLVIVPLGKGKSKVYEYEAEFVVHKSSLKIIEDSCLFFGSSYEGRKQGTKFLIGGKMKIPIIIDECRNIIFFPTSSCIKESSIWVSYQNLLKYNRHNEFSTVLYFKYNKSIRIGCKYSLVDNQVIRCIKLENAILKRINFQRKECTILDDFSY